MIRPLLAALLLVACDEDPGGEIAPLPTEDDCPLWIDGNACGLGHSACCERTGLTCWEPLRLFHDATPTVPRDEVQIDGDCWPCVNSSCELADGRIVQRATWATGLEGTVALYDQDGNWVAGGTFTDRPEDTPCRWAWYGDPLLATCAPALWGGSR